MGKHFILRTSKPIKRDLYGMFDTYKDARRYCKKNKVSKKRIQKGQNAMTSDKYRIFPLQWRIG